MVRYCRHSVHLLGDCRHSVQRHSVHRHSVHRHSVHRHSVRFPSLDVPALPSVLRGRLQWDGPFSGDGAHLILCLLR